LLSILLLFSYYFHNITMSLQDLPHDVFHVSPDIDH